VRPLDDGGEGRCDFIATRIAEAAAIALIGDRLLYGTFGLCAEGWPNRNEMTTIMGEIPGRPTKAERVNPKIAVAVAVPEASELEKMFDRYDHQGCLAARHSGREPLTLRNFVEELAIVSVAQ
jgi:hypothetical protein